MEIDASGVIERLRNKLAQRDWEIVLLEERVDQLQKQIDANESQVVEPEVIIPEVQDSAVS